VHLLDIELEVDGTRPGGGHAKLQQANIVRFGSVGRTNVGQGKAIRNIFSFSAGTYTIQESARNMCSADVNMSLSVGMYPSGAAAGSAKQTYRGSRPEFALKDSQT
jgi:hypothetical protein